MITVTNPPRFLIIQTAFIGDVILATALLEQLRAALPEAVLDVLVRTGNESLLAGHPFLNEVLTWNKKLAKYRDLWRILTLVRARKYDVILNLQRFGATGLLTALSKAKLTIGFAKNPFSRFFTCRVDHRYEPDIHEVDRNAGLLYPLGIHGPRTMPKLYPSEADYATARSYQAKPYVCIAPTTASGSGDELRQRFGGSAFVLSHERPDNGGFLLHSAGVRVRAAGQRVAGGANAGATRL